MQKDYSKSFSDANNTSDIEEEIIKQINSVKPFDMEPCKAIPKKPFVPEKENNCEEENNLTPQDRIGNIDCANVNVSANYFCSFFRLKSWSAKGASRHTVFMGNSPNVSHKC